MTTTPRWRRRAEERPGEIADAAFAAFAEHGYAAARLTDIAAAAGVSKAALYLYYPTKADLFRAVLLQRLLPQVGAATAAARGLAPGGEALERLLTGLAGAIASPGLRQLARVVIGESGRFPEISRAWRETVVAPALEALEGAVAQGQAAGRVRDGDARLIALSVVGPLLLAAIWKEVMEPAGGAPVDIAAVAREHARTLLEGLVR